MRAVATVLAITLAAACADSHSDASDADIGACELPEQVLVTHVELDGGTCGDLEPYKLRANKLRVSEHCAGTIADTGCNRTSTVTCDDGTRHEWHLELQPDGTWLGTDSLTLNGCSSAYELTYAPL